MRSNIILSLVSAIAFTGVSVNAQNVTGELGDAVTVKGNPAHVSYAAKLPESGNIKGDISATAGPGGVGTNFVVNFSDLPASQGPFSYHIHVEPVSSNGSCASTLGHLDPFVRGEAPPCDASAPQTCQVGDLSGKYGKVTSDPFKANYTDPYTSIAEGTSESFFGNRSFVLHNSTGARIACASFQLVTAATNGTGGAGNGTGGGSGGNGGGDNTPPISGGTRSIIVSAAGMLGAVAVAAMML